MKENIRYGGIIPALYACYGRDGEVSEERTRVFIRHLIQRGIDGIYVGGSSGECIYQSVEERKRTIRCVMEEAAGRIPVIVHVACNNTKDSCCLAAYAQEAGADAIAAIPPIYFKLPEHAVAAYWNSISEAAPDMDFIIYNIPQLAGTALTQSLLRTMLQNEKVIGVKNSSMPVQDIQMQKMIGGDDFIVFNGVDEQFISGRVMGADGGIGGTYAVMPELFLRMDRLVQGGDLRTALEIQMDVGRIIDMMCSCQGNLYAVMKEILRRREGIDIGGVREPLTQITEQDTEKIGCCVTALEKAISKYCRKDKAGGRYEKNT